MNKKASKNIQGWQNIQRHAEERFHQEIKDLRRLVKIWRDGELAVKKDSSEAAILVQYATCVEEVNNLDRLKGLFFVKPIKYEEETKGIKDEKNILMGISFLDQKEWTISFSKNFIKKIKPLSEPSILHIFFKLFLTGEGLIPFTEGKEGTYKTYQRQSKLPLEYFTLEIDHQDNTSYLLITVGVHKVPHYDFNNANGSKINDFAYVLMVTAEDIIHQASFYNEKFMKMITEGIEDYYEENPRTNYEKGELRMNVEAMNDKKNYYHSKKRDNQLGTKVCPTLYKSNIPTLLEIENYFFLLQKFNDYQDRASYLAIEKELKERMKEKQHEQMQEQQEDEENQLIELLEMETVRNEKFEFNNHSKILHYLQQIPNFKYALTKQQKQLLIRNGNLIIVGRSGTGKTTCAMLRLYGIQFLVKMNEFNNLKRQEKIEVTQTKCAIMLLNEIKLLKNIFLTFSGRLIDEIKKQYDDMIYQIHDKHAQKCQLCKDTLKKNSLDDEEEDPLDKLKRQEEEQQKKVISLSSIGNQDFPGFFTIQNFIRIIDKTVPRPFFSHKKQHQNQKNNAIIKHAYINRYEYTSKDIKLIQTFEAVYVDYNFFANHIWQELPRELTRASRQLCLLTPPIVWSEIFSILKGSLKSYLCPGGYMSFKMYLDDHQSIFQKQPEKMEEYKEKVYTILKSYMNWLKNENGYDLMDVVNHNLRQIELYGYSGPKINYMFVDEVQDLTSSTTFLISKMVLNNIFYCGDTAQAITKGVTFRFEDLKFIFNKQYCKNALELDQPEDIIYLTVNFRSHHFILQLANSIVSSIQQLFPNSITKIKKEKSDLIGPKPYILLDQNIPMLFYLICGPVQIKMDNIDGQQHLNDLIKESQHKQREKMKKKKKKKKGKKKQKKMDQMEQDEEDLDQIDSEEQKQTRKFNSQQIIIVRNLEQKQKMPKCLQQGIVLVPEAAKGLEFDEVILYNFFSSCPIFQKWNSLLQHLEPEQTYEDQKKFQEQLSRRTKQQKNEQEPLTDQVKKMLGYDQNRKQYRIWNIRGKQSIRGVNINLYLELASELKVLYTVITRARSVFALFDQKIPKNLFNLWKTLDLVTIVDEKNVEECHRLKNDYVYVKEKHKKYLNPDRHWFKAGSRMLARKDYENAKKCFANINRNDLVQRIEALEIQTKAQNILYRVKNGLKSLQDLPRDQRKIKKIKLQREKAQAYRSYRAAGKVYEKYARNNDAALAFFKAEQFELALQYYKLTQNKDKIAICCKKLKRYKQAINIFKEQEDIEAIVECYIEQKNWVQLFNMLINNPQYMHKFEQLNEIALDCIKNVLYKKLHSEDIMRAERNFKQYYRLSVKKNRDTKEKIEHQQFQQDVAKIVLQYDLSNLTKIKQKIEAQVKKYEEIQNNYFTARAKLELVQQQQEKIMQKIDKVKVQKSEVLQTERILIDKVQIYESEYLPQQREQLQTYNLIKQRLQALKYQKANLYQLHHELNGQINQVHQQIFQFQPIQRRYRLQYEQFAEKYQQKKNKQALALIQKKFKEIIKKLGQITMNKPNNTNISQRMQDDSDYASQICSLSDITQMNEVWDQGQDNIGGLQLHPPDKISLLSQINQILGISAKLFDTTIQDNYKPHHHKYIQQKMFKLLSEKTTALNYSSYVALKNGNKIGEYTSCLLMCDVNKQFICLSPKYILGYLLSFSQNFKQNRYFENEIYEIQTSEEAEEQRQDTQTQLTEVQAFLATLNDKGLLHKIPRLSFEDKFYYQTILSNITFGLMLQGYYQQLTMFLQPGPACKLAYLFSNYQSLTKHVKEIAKILKIKNLKDNVFLFTEDERILGFYPEVSVLNIFSIQSIFYAYDECQVEPFLSKKKTCKQFDIEQQTVEKLYDDADRYIKQMQLQNQQFQYEIRRLRQQIQIFQQCIKSQTIQKNFTDQIYKKEKKQLKQKLTSLNEILQNHNSYLQKQITQEAKAQLKYINTKIVHADKISYQNRLNQMLFEISGLNTKGKYQESQKLENKRMQLDQEYKDKRYQQKQSYQQLEKIKTRIKQRQGEIKKTKYEMTQIHRELQQIDKKVKSSTVKQIQEYYNQIIQRNQKEIKTYQSMRHKELDIKNQEQKKKAVVLRQMNKIKQQKYEQWMEVLREQNMENILKGSNIPYSAHFRFLTLYMKGQLSQKNQQSGVKMEIIAQVYHNIIKDGVKVDELLASTQNKQIKDIKMCNVIIFYLSFICNQSVRQDVNDALRITYQLYQQNIQKREQAYKSYKAYQTRIQFYNSKLYDMPEDQKVPKNWNYTNINHHINEARIMLEESRAILNQCKQYEEEPIDLLQKFMDTIYKKIKYLNAGEMHFMELLFGFFQCRIIRQCQVLNFLANQYVLVRHNSIVIQQLQEERRHPFAYYFDQKNQTVLCRFQDVQRIILGFIDKKHNQIYSVNYLFANQQARYKNKKKFMDVKLFGYMNKEETSQTKQMLQLTQFVQYSQKKNIKLAYDQIFIGDITMKDIKQSKNKIIEYFLKNKFTNPDSFFFASHQLREYYFLEKVLYNLNNFNYQLLKDVKKKKEALQKQYQRYIEGHK